MDERYRIPLRIAAAAAAGIALSLAALRGGMPDEAKTAQRIQEQAAARLLSELDDIEALTYQFVANPSVNALLDLYSSKPGLYDSAVENLSFSRHLESQDSIRDLVAEAVFFDADEEGRVPLTMTEDLVREDLARLRAAARDAAAAAGGACAWGTEPLALSAGTYIFAARQIRRLRDGRDLGFFVALVDVAHLSWLANSVDYGTPSSSYLVSANGVLVAGPAVPAVGGPSAGGRVAEAVGPSSYFEAIMAQGQAKGRFFADVGGKRAPAAFVRVGDQGLYLLTTFPAADKGPRTALLAAAAGFALAAAAAAALSTGTRRAAAGTAAASGPAGSAGPGREEPAWVRILTPREKELVDRLARGMSNKEIAFEFGIKEQTVKNYLGPLYDKLGVHDRLSALLVIRGERPPREPGAEE